MHSLIKELRQMLGKGPTYTHDYQNFKKLFNENDDFFLVLEERNQVVDSSFIMDPTITEMSIHVVQTLIYEVHDKMTTDEPKAFFKLEIGHNLGRDPYTFSSYQLTEVEPVVKEEKVYKEVAFE